MLIYDMTIKTEVMYTFGENMQQMGSDKLGTYSEMTKIRL